MAFYDRYSTEKVVEIHRLIGKRHLISAYGHATCMYLLTADKRVLCSVQCGSFNTTDTNCTVSRRLIVPYNRAIITIMLSGIRRRNDTKKKKAYKQQEELKATETNRRRGTRWFSILIYTYKGSGEEGEKWKEKKRKNRTEGAVV